MVWNAFLSSLSSIVLTFFSSNTSCMEWMAASLPAFCLVHNFEHPIALMTSVLTTEAAFQRYS